MLPWSVSAIYERWKQPQNIQYLVQIIAENKYPQLGKSDVILGWRNLNPSVEMLTASWLTFNKLLENTCRSAIPPCLYPNKEL